MNSWIVVTLLVLFIVAFLLAWASLGELDAPKEAFSEFLRQRAAKVRQWGTIIFLEGREIFYQGETKEKKNEDKQKLTESA